MEFKNYCEVLEYICKLNIDCSIIEEQYKKSNIFNYSQKKKSQQACINLKREIHSLKCLLDEAFKFDFNLCCGFLKEIMAIKENKNYEIINLNMPISNAIKKTSAFVLIIESEYISIIKDLDNKSDIITCIGDLAYINISKDDFIHLISSSYTVNSQLSHIDGMNQIITSLVNHRIQGMSEEEAYIKTIECLRYKQAVKTI